MKCLFLDLASHQGVIACVSDSAVASLTPVDHRIDDAALAGLIEGTLKAAGWTYKEVDRVACVVGPGGFTSLRVAVACCNALAYALEIPSLGIHLSDLYKARLTLRSTEIVWMHSTKKLALFLKHLDRKEEAVCIETAALADHLPKGSVWTGELIPEHRVLVDQLQCPEAPLQPLEEILPSFLASQPYDRGDKQPWYGRGW